MWFLLGCAMLKALQLFSWVVQYTCRGVWAGKIGLPALPNRDGLLIWVMDRFLGGTLASQIDIPNQPWCLGCCNCEKHHFSHHTAPLGFPRVLPPIKSFLGGCPFVGNISFPLIISLHTGLLGAPSDQLFLVGCLTMGNTPPGISPSGYLPATPPLLFPFMYVPIHSQYIWFLKYVVQKMQIKMQIKCE